MNINFNPYKTNGQSGGFVTNSDGMTQGDAWDDPAVRLQLASGLVLSTLTVPLYPGQGIIESVPLPTANVTGSVITNATESELDGFVVSNQAFHGVITPNSNVPQYGPGGTVHYYRVGSGARVPLPISAAVAALANGTTSVRGTSFWWNPTTQVVDIAGSGGIVLKLLRVSATGNMVASYNSGTGNFTWSTTGVLGLFQI